MRDAGATPGSALQHDVWVHLNKEWNAVPFAEFDDDFEDDCAQEVQTVKVKIPEPRIINLEIERVKPDEPKTVKVKIPEPRIVKIEVTR